MAIDIVASKQEFDMKVSKTHLQLEKVESVFGLILRARHRHKNEIKTALTYGASSEQIRKRAIHRADISRRAINRLSEHFNNLVMEIQL